PPCPDPREVGAGTPPRPRTRRPPPAAEARAAGRGARRPRGRLLPGGRTNSPSGHPRPRAAIGDLLSPLAPRGDFWSPLGDGGPSVAGLRGVDLADPSRHASTDVD